MARTLLTLASLTPPELRDLLARVGLAEADGLRALRAAAPIVALSAAERPYARLALQSGAGRVGLQTSTFTPAEVQALGEGALAGATVGLHTPAVALIGWELAALAAFAERCPAPCIAMDAASGCPVGALADLVVLASRRAPSQHRLAIVGDASPRAMDLASALASLGGSVNLVHPVGFAPDADRLTLVRERAAAAGGAVLDTTELLEGLRDATAVFVEPFPPGEVERFRAFALARHHLRVCRPSPALLHRIAERRGPELSATLVEDGGWCAPAQRQAESFAAAAVLSWMLQPDRARSVLGCG
jgi:ornithine carbamoyltransferase